MIGWCKVLESILTTLNTCNMLEMYLLSYYLVRLFIDKNQSFW